MIDFSDEYIRLQNTIEDKLKESELDYDTNYREGFRGYDNIVYSHDFGPFMVLEWYEDGIKLIYIGIFGEYDKENENSSTLSVTESEDALGDFNAFEKYLPEIEDKFDYYEYDGDYPDGPEDSSISDAVAKEKFDWLNKRSAEWIQEVADYMEELREEREEEEE